MRWDHRSKGKGLKLLDVVVEYFRSYSFVICFEDVDALSCCFLGPGGWGEERECFAILSLILEGCLLFN